MVEKTYILWEDGNSAPVIVFKILDKEKVYARWGRDIVPREQTKPITWKHFDTAQEAASNMIGRYRLNLFKEKQNGPR